MLGLIWAQGHDRAIGVAGAIPWRVPEDMALFRRLTSNATVLMGRATWDSLPEAFRPLPKRQNVVITRDAAFRAPGAIVTHDIASALDAADSENIWVIGGAQIYGQTIGIADLAVVTDIDVAVPDADAYAPSVPEGWQPQKALPERGWLRSSTGLSYRFTVYAPGPVPALLS